MKIINKFLFAATGIIYLIFSISVYAQSDDEVEIFENGNTPLAIRGADIEDVSRIVIDGIPEPYRVIPFDKKLHIIFEDFEYSFLKQDLLSIGILKNISKLSVKTKDNFTILEFKYSCACQGDFYEWYNQKLVLDVYSLDAVINPLKRKNKVTQEKNERPSDPSKEVIDKDPATQIDQKNTKKENMPENDQEIEIDGQQTSQEFAVQLQKLINAASKRGLVDLKDNFSENIDHAPKVDVTKPIASDTETITSNIHISEDTVLSPTETAKLLPTDKNMFLDNDGVCLPDAAFNLPPNDPEFDTFYDKISDYRDNLIGEFDVLNPEDALKLALHYISYGLGEEALQVLSNFPIPEHRGHIAKSMAELLTNSPLSGNSVFQDADDCSGAQALWAAYRYFKLGNEVKAAQLSRLSNITEVIKTFPTVLQLRIGSNLALNLVRYNNDQHAIDIVDTLAQSTDHFSSNILLVRGLIDAKNGHADRALKILQDVMDKTNGIDQQMAGLALAELKLASSIELNERDVSILEEVFFLKSRELIGVQALALIAENETRYGNFYKAFERLSQNIYVNPQIKDAAEIKAEQLFKRIAVSGEAIDNPNTLNIYWKFNHLVPKDPKYLQAYATRLYEIGYDESGIDVISDLQKKHPEYAKENDVTYLKGQLLYRQGRYKDVINAMDQPFKDDTAYMQLKANAYHKLGYHNQAIALLKSFEDKKSLELRAQYALAQRDWNKAYQDFRSVKEFDQDPEYYYRIKASAYMSGFRFPGKASQYKKPEDVVFHQPDRQAQTVNNAVMETKKLIELIDYRSSKIQDIITEKQLSDQKLKQIKDKQSEISDG